MTWEAVNALATLFSAVVVAVAAIAAVVQIRHLRTGNQLEAVLKIYDRFETEEMILARRYCLEELPKALAGAAPASALMPGGADVRVILVGNFLNEIGTLVVDGFVEERLVWPLAPTSARIWKIVAPLAAEWRRTRQDPVWADFEYLAAIGESLTRERHVARFPPWFRERLRMPAAQRGGADA